jgi:hypothetical protein
MSIVTTTPTNDAELRAARERFAAGLAEVHRHLDRAREHQTRVDRLIRERERWEQRRGHGIYIRIF